MCRFQLPYEICRSSRFYPLDGLDNNLSGKTKLNIRYSESHVTYQWVRAVQLFNCFAADCTPVLIQQNVDGSNFFNRSWAEFIVGFGNSNGNFWLGNERLSKLTQQGRYKLWFELQERGTNHWYWAEYSTFVVLNEASNYTLHVAGYSSNTGYDSLGYSNGMMFTTYDRDNDRWGSNCAVSNEGGFWYNDCNWCSVNTVRGKGNDFRWWNGSRDIDLQTSRMWLKCL